MSSVSFNLHTSLQVLRAALALSRKLIAFVGGLLVASCCRLLLAAGCCQLLHVLLLAAF